MNTKIYVLCEPDGEIRYIGKTGATLKERFYYHLSAAKLGKQSYRCNWIRSVLATGRLPFMQLIGEVEGDGCKEEIAWIAYGKQEGWRLVNGTDGGEGLLGCKSMLGKHHSPEARKKISEAQKGEKSVNFGKHLSAETRRKISESHKREKRCWFGKHFSAETRKKMSGAHKGVRFSFETRKRMSESHKGKKGYWLGKHFPMETCKKISEAQKGKHPSIETRKKLSESRKAMLRKRKELELMSSFNK